MALSPLLEFRFRRARCIAWRLTFLGMTTVILLDNPINAATYKGGLINGEIWTRASSPYIVTNNIQIKRLSIDPGVQVLIDGSRGSHEIEVDGDLSAVGASADSILFSTTTNSASKWLGIRFNGPSTSELAHCVIENSTRRGITINQCSPIIRSCTVRSNACNDSFRAKGGGIYTDSPLTLSDSTVVFNVALGANSEMGASAYGGGIYSETNLVLVNCSVALNGALADVKRDVGYAEGGGVFVAAGRLAATDCNFITNLAVTAGLTGSIPYI